MNGGFSVSYETIRAWCQKFGPQYARRLLRRPPGYGDTIYVGEVFVRIGGVRRYLWRAIDQEGEVVDVYLTEKRDAAAAKRFFRRVLKASKGERRRIVSDKLASSNVAHRELTPDSIRVTSR